MKNHHSIYLLIINQILGKYYAHVTAIKDVLKLESFDNKNKNKIDCQSTGFVSIQLSVGGNIHRLICSGHPINRFIHSRHTVT